jgi:hypothetical protein
MAPRLRQKRNKTRSNKTLCVIYADVGVKFNNFCNLVKISSEKSFIRFRQGQCFQFFVIIDSLA